MTYYIILTANKRDYSLTAPNPEKSDTAVTYTAYDTRVTSFGDTRVTSFGDTRITANDETSYPYELTANKRDYTLQAPKIQVE